MKVFNPTNIKIMKYEFPNIVIKQSSFHKLVKYFIREIFKNYYVKKTFS